MDSRTADRFRIKVWKDRMPRPSSRWGWEVWERTTSVKVVACGSAFGEADARAAAADIVERRLAVLGEMRRQAPYQDFPTSQRVDALVLRLRETKMRRALKLQSSSS